MPRQTVSVDYWKCPWCKELHTFESERAEAERVGDLSGFSDEQECPDCGKTATVSLSIQFRAEPVVE